MGSRLREWLRVGAFGLVVESSAESWGFTPVVESLVESWGFMPVVKCLAESWGFMPVVERCGFMLVVESKQFWEKRASGKKCSRKIWFEKMFQNISVKKLFFQRKVFSYKKFLI